jgi:quercetin dioxygenase-like cupin family protein
MSGIRILAGHFAGKEQALAEITSDGYWPISWIDKPGAIYEPHRHCDDETLYVVDGSIDFTDLTTGATHHLGPGDKLFLPARLPHSASSKDGATYIMGIRTLVAFEDHVLPLE